MKTRPNICTHDGLRLELQSSDASLGLNRLHIGLKSQSTLVTKRQVVWLPD